MDNGLEKSLAADALRQAFISQIMTARAAGLSNEEILSLLNESLDTPADSGPAEVISAPVAPEKIDVKDEATFIEAVKDIAPQIPNVIKFLKTLPEKPTGDEFAWWERRLRGLLDEPVRDEYRENHAAKMIEEGYRIALMADGREYGDKYDGSHCAAWEVATEDLTTPIHGQKVDDPIVTFGGVPPNDFFRYQKGAQGQIIRPGFIARKGAEIKVLLRMIVGDGN